MKSDRTSGKEPSLSLTRVTVDAPLSTVIAGHEIDAVTGFPVPTRSAVDEAARDYRRIALAVCFVLPMIVAVFYYGLVAADLYESESRFVLRQGAVFGSGSSGSVLEQAGLAAPDENSHIIKAYIESRDLTERLAAENSLVERLSVPEADFVNSYETFWRSGSMEALYEHFQGYIDVDIDGSTGITTLSVLAFRAADATELSVAILDHAEKLVNRLNDRAQKDAIQFAEEVVARNEDRVKALQDRLTDFRNAELVLDPGSQSTATLQLRDRLLLEAAEMDTRIASLTESSPTNPSINQFKTRREALQSEIEKLNRSVVGDPDSMASKLSAYEKLVLEKDLATRALSGSLLTLERARQDAQTRKLYLERIVEPKPADRPEHPRRLLMILAAAALFYCFYRIVWSMIDLALERLR